MDPGVPSFPHATAGIRYGAEISSLEVEIAKKDARIKECFTQSVSASPHVNHANRNSAPAEHASLKPFVFIRVCFAGWNFFRDRQRETAQ